MRLKDFMDRAMLISGLKVDAEALFYYNEFIDYLLALYPEKITAPQIERVKVTENRERKFTIPNRWASILKVKNSAGRRVQCEIIDDVLVFPGTGEYEIRYTKKPGFMKSMDEPLEHNRIFDLCIPYYFAWKMCERDQLSSARIQKAQTMFMEYLNVALKSKAKQGLKHIKVQPFR